MKPELVVVGFTNIDENTTPSTKTESPGGAGYFVAIAASRIIPNVGLVSRIGYDFDTNFLRTRVQNEGLHIDIHEPTGRSNLLYKSDTDKGERDISLEIGANKNLSPADIPKSWLSDLKYVHIATMPPDQQFEFIHFFNKRTPYAFLTYDTDIYLLQDSKKRLTVEEDLRHIHLAFVNRAEYKVLKMSVDQLPDAIVKLDKDGAMYLSKGKLVEVQKGTPVTAVDATGAGDIFAGTFLACRLIGHDISQSLKEAVKIASLSVTKNGVSHLFS